MTVADPSNCVSGEVTRRDMSAGTRVVRAAAWLTRAKFTAGALVAVYDHQERVLLVQQRRRSRQMWGLPGGFQRRGELPINAAARELLEETGLDLTEEELAPVSCCQQAWASHYDSLYSFTYTEAEPPPIKPRSREIRRAGWFPLHGDSLPGPLNAASMHALLKHLHVDLR